MKLTRQDFVHSIPAEPSSALGALAPRTKARRFCLLLPAIERKIREGVSHADIIQALREQGLEFTDGTYFNYLQRYRTRATMAPAQGAAAHENASRTAPTAAIPSTSLDVSENAARRPPTFDYDPHGIPDLLK